jgi:hypothetical protein
MVVRGRNSCDADPRLSQMRWGLEQQITYEQSPEDRKEKCEIQMLCMNNVFMVERDWLVEHCIVKKGTMEGSVPAYALDTKQSKAKRNPQILKKNNKKMLDIISEINKNSFTLLHMEMYISNVTTLNNPRRNLLGRVYRVSAHASSRQKPAHHHCGQYAERLL